MAGLGQYEADLGKFSVHGSSASRRGSAAANAAFRQNVDNRAQLGAQLLLYDNASVVVPQVQRQLQLTENLLGH